MNMLLLLMVVLLFLNVFHVMKVTAVCEEFGTCSASQNMKVPACYCDAKCYQYNDCCKEVMLRNNTTHPLLTSTEETCVLLTSQTNSKIAERLGSFMIGTCNGSKVQCEVEKGELKTWIPVSSGNRTYRNADCAICNGEKTHKNWGILFKIPHKYTKFITQGGHVNAEDVLDYINNGTLETSADYYLQPPNGIPLRFCPFDVSSDNTTFREQYSNYQNSVICKEQAYKNIDVCSNGGCCNTSLVYCTEYYVYLQTALGTSEKSSYKGLHISLRFQQNENDELLPTEDEAKADMFFIGNRISVFMALSAETKGSTSFIDCVHAGAAYLRSTDYVLVPLFDQFITKSDDNRFIAFYISRSDVKLSTIDLNNLLKLGLSIRCRAEGTNHTITGTISVHEDHYNIADDALFKIFENTPLRAEIWNLFRYKPLNLVVIKECRNLSLIIPNWNDKETLIRILCLDTIAFHTSATNTLSFTDICHIGFLCCAASLMLIQ